MLQWETRWFAGGARALEDNVVWCKSPVRWRVVSCLRDGAWSTEHGGCWAGARRLVRPTAVTAEVVARATAKAVAIPCVLRKFLAATC